MSEINESFYEEDEDEWEDSSTYEKILASVPDGWALVRVMAGYANLIKMREWLHDNSTGGFKEVNWDNGGCSYSVGVMLEKEIDIVLFKLRWGY